MYQAWTLCWCSCHLFMLRRQAGRVGLASSILIGILLLSQKPFTFKPNKWILTARSGSLQPLLSLHSSYWVKTWNFASTSNKLKLQVTVGNSRKLSFTLNEYFDSTFNIQHSERTKRNAKLEINFYWIWNVVTVYSTESGAVETSNNLY